MRRSPLRVELSCEERSTLEHWLRCTSTANGLAQRIRVVLRFADGQRIVPIGRELGLARNTVKLWLRRFSEKRLEGLDDQPRSGRPLVFSPRGGRTPGETGLRATG